MTEDINHNYSFKKDSNNPPLQKTSAGHTILSSKKIEDLNQDAVVAKDLLGEIQYKPISFTDNPKFLSMINYEQEILESENYSNGEHDEELELNTNEELTDPKLASPTIEKTYVKFCRNCGNKFEEADNFCCCCGAKRK